MNKVFPKPQLTPFEADYARWCEEQGALLRAGRLDQLDRVNLAEEIESLGRSERYEIESRLSVLLVHLLKWQFQAAKRKSGWKSTIQEQRSRLTRRLKDNPSLRGYPSEILAEEYAIARSKAADETKLSEDVFPVDCPYSMSQIVDPSFLPEA